MYKEIVMVDIALSEQDLETLDRLAKHESGVMRQRVRAILLAGRGLAAEEIASQVRLSSRQVAYWLRQFEQHGAAIFPQAPAPVTESSPPSMPRPRIPVTGKPGLQSDDPMSEAGRKILAYYFARFLAQETPVRAGENGEAVHDMRVATRRLRSALNIFGPFLRERTIKPFEKELRRVGRSLGTVRDLEVALAKAEKYISAALAGDGQGLQPLLDEWQCKQAEARTSLIKTLDSDRYSQFLADFAEFVTTPGLGAVEIKHNLPIPHLVCHVAPRLIYERYEAVRAYGPLLEETSLDRLHALRIDSKRLRYALEAFTEVLGSEAKDVIDKVKALQEHLGDLQDTRVASDLLFEFIQNADPLQPMAAVLQYLSAKQEEKRHLLVTLPQVWDAINQPEFRRDLGLAVAAL
jgi:CHAD domain-containing protein